MKSERRTDHLAGRLWLLLVSAVGLPLIGISLLRVAERDSWGWLWMALAVALTSSLGARISLRGLGLGGMAITASDCITIVALVCVNVWVAIVLAGVDSVVVLVKMRVKRLDRKIFNISQMALTSFLAGAFFSWLESITLVRPPNWPLLAVLMLVTGAFFYLTNFLLITVAMVLHSGASLTEVWARNLGSISPALLLNLLSGVGFLMPILIPAGPSLLWGMVAVSGLISSLFYSRRLAQVNPLLLT